MNSVKIFIVVVCFTFNLIAYSQEFNDDSFVMDTNVKLYGTVINEAGKNRAVITINGGKQSYVVQNELISKNIILHKVYREYAVLKTPSGFVSIDIVDREITYNEALYDPNLEVGQSRTFYESVKENR